MDIDLTVESTIDRLYTSSKTSTLSIGNSVTGTNTVVEFRFGLLAGYSGSGKNYRVKDIVLQAKKSNTKNDSVNLSFSSNSCTFGNFKTSSHNSNGVSSVVSLSSLTVLAWKTIVTVASYNTYSYTNDVYGSSTFKATVVPGIYYYNTYSPGVSRSLYDSFTINCKDTRRTLTYLKENGSVYGSPVYGAYNSTTQIQSGYTKQPYTDRAENDYTVSFNSNGGTHVDSRKKHWSWSRTTTYRFSSWGGYPPGTTYYFRSNESIKAIFASDVGPTTWTYQTFGSLPTVYRKGYESTNVWYYQNGTPVNSGDEVKSDLTVYCKWEFPKTYQIDFNLNGGRIPEEYDQSIKNYSLSKMYGTSVKAPSFTPYRLGYSFAGWSNQTGSLAKVQPNGNIDDRYYNEVNGDQTNINVTLYAQWTPKVNTIYFRYYLADNGELKTDTITYTIERADKTVTKNAPKSLRGGDFAFLGWCDQKPRGWDKSSYANNGYHGTYTLPPEKVVDEDGNEIDVELPVTIDINKLTKLEDWGVTEEYYGIWAKSGKYIKISNSWRKVVRSYVKIGGEWKLVRDIWTKQGGAWKHEI